MKKRWKLIFFATLSLLSACNTISGIGKDNTPTPSSLASYTPQVQTRVQWLKNTGVGSNGYYLALRPTITNDRIYIANADGQLAAFDKSSGQQIWKTNVSSIVSGPACSDKIILVVGDKGKLSALNIQNGQLIWQSNLQDHVIALPTIAQDNVYIKTVSGQLIALSITTGQQQWRYIHETPNFSLATSSSPIILDNSVITGYADGKLAAYDTQQGKLLWEQTIAQSTGATEIEQMVDIAADPVVNFQTLYVVTYQGNLAAINKQNGEIKWQQPLSSYTGMALTTNAIFITDAVGDVWAFDRNNGKPLWHQAYLQHRKLTAPAVVNNAIVIGDGEGYLHYLNQANGQTIGRLLIAKDAAIVAAPVVDEGVVYALTTQGQLAAIKVN